MLKVAVPNKGALSEGTITMLTEAGYRQRSDAKDLVLMDRENQVEFYYLRPRDIAIYVGDGILDLGFTGRDMLLDSGSPAQEIMALGYGKASFRFAGPLSADLSVADIEGKRIATSYPGLLKQRLDELGVDARLVNLDGAVESAIRLQVADFIADVVQTGSTLAKAGLEVFGEPLLESEAILVKRPNADLDEAIAAHLIQRLSSVQVAREYMMVDYDVPEHLLERACQLTPGIEAPTISPLAKEGWVAVRALVKGRGAQRLMDDLWDLGARGILLTDLAAVRL